MKIKAYKSNRLKKRVNPTPQYNWQSNARITERGAHLCKNKEIQKILESQNHFHISFSDAKYL